MRTAGPSALVRPATPEDVGAILDLLVDYGLPRDYFEPFYLSDPTYRPSYSWVVEEHGRLVSHVRIFDRLMRVGGCRLRVAGLGNVITASDRRGRGYANELLRAIGPVLVTEGFAYSLLWTHLPDLYARHGWVPIEQQLVVANLPKTRVPFGACSPFRLADLADLMRLYDGLNASRTGTTIRSEDYWRGQLQWLHEDLRQFLVARAEDGHLEGFVRSRLATGVTEVLELGVEASRSELGGALLSACCASSEGRLRGHFPPSLLGLFQPYQHQVTRVSGLMGRVANCSTLARAVEQEWLKRARAARFSSTAVTISRKAGHVSIELDSSSDAMGGANPPPFLVLSEEEFAHLLFHGFDTAVPAGLHQHSGAVLLSALFPEQDFVIWASDRF